MPESQQKLSTKIISILMIFFVVALAAVGMTLLISWQLEGGAAAINDAGSLRMRSYRIAHLLQRGASPTVDARELGTEMGAFSEVLGNLQRGDPLRPLSPPRDEQTRLGLEKLHAQWLERMQPLLEHYLASADPAERSELAKAFDIEVPPFVGQIDQFVLAMEHSYAFNTNLLRTCQLGLILLAVFGTLVMIRFFFVQVIRPVDQLHAGIKRMLSEDFSVRLPRETRDEFGALADGFNRMVEHLQTLYATLEQRVDSKTRSLAERNHELGILYQTAAFLNEPDDRDELCQGFLQRIREAMGADGAAIRLQAPDGDGLFVVAHAGLSEAFIAKENSMRCGECLCGGAMLNGIAVQVDTRFPPSGMTSQNCAREGFRVASAFNIVHQKQVLGVFNLYYRQERHFTSQEMSLLELLSGHLGIAIENQRLRVCEREAAVYEERNLLAQELHDSIAQGLAFLNIQSQLLQSALRRTEVAEAQEVAGHIRDGIKESYDDVRELLVHFRTRVSHADLDTAILTAIERFEMQTGVATEFERSGTGLLVAGDDSIQILHIVQEALSNIRKHAQATRVKVVIGNVPEGIAIHINDNGIGFDPAAELPEAHVGLKIMKERAVRAGARCTLASAPGQGTTVSVVLRRKTSEETGNE